MLQVRAAHAVQRLLASAARASRREAWRRWTQAVAGAAVTERLRGARRASLQRCVRARQLRDAGAAWEAMRSRVRRSRALASGAARLEGALAGARQRTLSRRLGIWRSESLAGVIAAGERRAATDRRREAVRRLVSTVARVRRQRIEGGWRALVLCAVDRRRVDVERASRAARADLLARGAAERSRRRVLARAWKAWAELLVQRRLRGAVGAATSSLEGERASLARQVQLLRISGAVRLMVSIAERSNRCAVVRVSFDGAW